LKEISHKSYSAKNILITNEPMSIFGNVGWLKHKRGISPI